MDELVQSVAAQTGLPEAQAKQAAEAVMAFLKEKLPAPLASQVDSVVNNANVASGAEDLLKKGLGLLGGKK